MAAVTPQPTLLADLEDVVRILNNLQVVSAETGVYVSEGSLALRDSDLNLVGALRVDGDGENYSFVPGVLR